MSTGTTAIVIAVIAIVLLAVAAAYASRFFLRKAMREIVALFRAQGATDPATAVKPEQLGLVWRNPIGGMSGLRDYRPNALQLLGQAGVIRGTEEGTLYLAEEDLADSPLKRYAKIK
ncbi:MAG: hypothetical protein JW990_02495 [Thermoleophilia bacterium]|nr:hypothetical protein [Thermoleophilia bacterium]